MHEFTPIVRWERWHPAGVPPLEIRRHAGRMPALPAREIVSDQGESSLHQTAGLIHQTRSLMHQTKSRQIKVRNFFAQGWIGSVGNVPIRRSALRSSRITLKRGHHAASSVIQHHPASSNVFERQRPTSSNVIQHHPAYSRVKNFLRDGQQGRQDQPDFTKQTHVAKCT